ncbi:Stress protein H5 [Sedimentisphaera cyanobacteriorum]|uniref:Chaperonin GroEL n=1 Tax=Sedimentisphaera cyanobacteriorum TaxID=1940790 RepID=A0A1Q2HQQ6_9BACT|nr:chaperonin GroEL [Sedimentisphaera cyanobacteriorum]AQQ09573.1 Stress protein H5 [Sedimentisphaera cyanobacteriorum]
MAKKELSFETDARASLLSGVEKLSAAVKSTLGPRGRCAIIDKGWGSPTVTKDGVTVAEEIDLFDKNENMAASLVKEAASKTNKKAGDGTTTATVLAEAIFKEAYRNLAAGADPMAMNRGIKKAVEAAVKQLAKISKPVNIESKKDIVSIASISANNDKEIGKQMAEAFTKVGKDGVITVEEGKGLETSVDYVEGMQFDRGFLSPHFATNSDSMLCEMSKPYVLIYEDKISNVQKIVPLLEEVAKTKRPLLIIAEDVEGEALATLVVNKMRGVVDVCAVKAPGYGDRRKAMLEDIAACTGGEAVMKDLGVELDSLQLAQLGQAKKIVVDNDSTVIVEGAGAESDIQARINMIKGEIEATTSDYDREKLQERMAKLTGGVAQINVGAGSEAEMKEKKARIEDALHATRAALEEGIVAGGGVALVRCMDAVKKLKLKGDEKTGANAVANALKMPCHCIAENAGAVANLVVNNVLEGEDGYGYNANTGKYENLIEAGVIDPVKVTRIALENSASVAGLLMTTDCVVTQSPDEDSGAGAGMDPSGGMGGMGGMPGMGGMGGMGGMPGMGMM